MLALALAAVVAGAAPAPAPRVVVVLEVSKRPGTESVHSAIAERVHAAMEREGVPGLIPNKEGVARLKTAGISDVRSCQAVRACVAKLAVILGEKAVVVGVDVARAGSSLAVLLEAVTGPTGRVDAPGDEARVLATTDFVMPAGRWSDEAALPMVRFVRQLKDTLAAEAPRPVVEAPASDAPRAVQLQPSAAPGAPQVAAAPAAPKSPRALPWILFGGAVVSAGAGATLLGLGLADKDALERSVTTNEFGERVSTLSRDQITALEGGGNAKLTAALISAILAAGLAVGTTAAFVAGN